MKKIISILVAVCALVCVSCSKDDVEKTATAALAGEWYAQIEYYDLDDDEWYEWSDDVHILTYNTAANIPTEMFIEFDDFVTLQCKVDCDVNTLTFGVAGKEYTNLLENANGLALTARIYDGKVTKNGALSAAGTPIDAIEFTFETTPDYLILGYGLDWPTVQYRVTGYRRTGFVADEP